MPTDLSNLDKTQLSNLADLIRSGMEHLDENILSLKPHQQKAEGYLACDIADAEDKRELGASVLEDITSKMADAD